MVGANLIKFNPLDPNPLIEAGLLPGAIGEILLGRNVGHIPTIPEGSPNWARSFISREYRACEPTFQAIHDKVSLLPHPCTGTLCQQTYNFIPSGFKPNELPIFKIFGEDENKFCVAYCGITSRVTHLLVPNLRCVIYDLDIRQASTVLQAYEQYSAKISVGKGQKNTTVGLVNMVPNFAHQAMNYLSGIQRVIEGGSSIHLDELWIVGKEFYGPTERLFPELSSRIKRKTREQVLLESKSADINFYPIGSNVLTASLRSKIMKQAESRYPIRPHPHPRYPLVGITMRSEQRRCVNLAEIVIEVIGILLVKYPNLGIMFDGWVLPESTLLANSNIATVFSEPHFTAVREEILVLKKICGTIPSRVVVGSAVGASMLESISALREIDVYFAHVGTLQHKVSWFSNASGVVHGPTTELKRFESSYYSCETAKPPSLVLPVQVLDHSDKEKLPGYFDYSINNAKEIAELLEVCISSSSLRWKPPA